MDEKEIHQFVLTGGPCGGKTTALSYLSQKIQELGYHVIIVPEVPTLLMTNGVIPVGFASHKFQEFVFKTILDIESVMLSAAQLIAADKVVVLYDRGIIDGRAYCPSNVFEDIAAKHGQGVARLRDDRYDAIFHLRSAAIGAAEFYTCANNTARRETVSEAEIMDEQTLRAWVGHPHLHVIDNSTSFDQKLKRLLVLVCHHLGLPEPLEIEKKYLVKPLDLMKLRDEVFYEMVEIEQYYLIPTSEGEEIRHRKRGHAQSHTYYRTTKRTVSPGVRVETEKRITEEEYCFGFKHYRRRDKRVIIKNRYCFEWQNVYYELDIFKEPSIEEWVLEIELTDEKEEIPLPPWFTVLADVTTDTQYSNASLATL